MSQPSREQWGSKLGFILAAAGSAIGLGNIWKFPYIAGENGGAAFIFVYLICIILIGLPILLSEIVIGRTTQKNPVGAFAALSKNSPFWKSIGGMGVLAGFIILSYYAVIAGWSLGYIYEAVSGNFYNFAEPTLAGEHFTALTQNVVWILGYFLLFMAITIGVVLFGIKKGIERGSKIMMPILVILLLVLMIKGITLVGAEKGIEFFLYPDWSKITPMAILIALGHAFFTLSLGMGAMLTYGSYMSKKSNVITSGVQIVFLDTLIALMAGLAIFTAVFATGLKEDAGPGLIFQTLPVVFTKMPGGYIFSILFFLLLSIAALTSSISLLEVITSYFIDEKGWTRKKAVLIFGTVTTILGIPSALSYNVLSDFSIFGLNFFDFVDFIAANVLLPTGGLFIALFAGHFWGFNKAVANIKVGAEDFLEKYPIVILYWKIFLKYVSPILIFIVLLQSIGVLDYFINLFN